MSLLSAFSTITLKQKNRVQRQVSSEIKKDIKYSYAGHSTYVTLTESNTTESNKNKKPLSSNLVQLKLFSVKLKSMITHAKHSSL